MPEPTIVQSTNWIAAARLDGGHQTFAEALAALQATGLQFDPGEMSQHGLVEETPGVYRICPTDQKGAVIGWVVPQ